MTRRPRVGTHESGFVTIQHVLATGLSLLMFTLLANLIVVQYGRGVARAAADDGARAGARTVVDVPAALAACQDTAERTRDGLVSGRMAEGIAIVCDVGSDQVRARAEFRLDAWLPAMPAFTGVAEASVIREGQP